jgi:RNA polymerase sigma-70 factor (ECF subfamily)
MTTVRIRVTTITEMTTTSSASPSPSTGRPDSGAAGVLVGRLFAEHSRMVLGLCRLLLRDPVEAEDAAQQVFLSAHRALLGGSVPRDAHAWLAVIARNECRARIHARMREPLALRELPSDLPDPLAAAIRATDLDAIWVAISSLPRRQRRALVLREVAGLSYHELGRALGVSHSSVESLLFRARQQVRALVGAAAPLAIRDDLARLIPGFDPGSAGLAARVAAIPVGLKLATAAVSVGVVTTGAAQLPDPHLPLATKTQATVSSASVSLPDPIERKDTVLVSERRAPARRASHAREREHEHRREAEPAEQEPVEAEREPAEVEPARAEESHDGGSENSGPGSDGSGLDFSGSSGGDSQPDGIDD